MARCKDCIHDKVCDEWAVTSGIPFVNSETCEHFTPTADVVPKSEVDKLELTLQGVMWSVDKWLDEADYDADPIKRAITMREKTLQIVENAKTEIARKIFEEIDRETKNHGITYAQRKIAELKKKYKEEEK